MSRPALRAAWLVAGLLAAAPRPAAAFEVTRLDGRMLRFDITATTVAAYHLDNRNTTYYDDNYFDLFNRINLQVSYWRFTAAARLDTATFAGAPEAHDLALKHARDPNDADEVNALQNTYWRALRSRHRDAYWLGKAFVTYSSPALEVTAGDAYVSFGRGLVLSLRKQDELAVDNTLLGGKVVGRLGWFTGTVVGGVANPVRVDEATGQGLFPVTPSAAEAARGLTEVPNFENDRLAGARLEGTWSGVTVALQGAFMSRPSTLGETTGIRGADTIWNGGASLNAPFPKGVGGLYLEGAYQRYSGLDVHKAGFEEDGFALYGSLNGGSGPVTAVLDVQHYRNFNPLYATAHATDANTFRYLAYSTLPTTEPVTTDTRPNFFERCVTGGRSRLNGRVAPTLMLYGTLGYWATWGERVGVEVVRGEEAADPASVAFRAVESGTTAGVDTVIVDTAGRLQNKQGLMDELGKVKRVIEKQAPVTEVLLVLDATTGQNGLIQARVFSEAVAVTGIVLTKLDGSAKGGIVVQVQRELGVPVKLVGLGEGPDDLAPFDAGAFVDALLG